MSIKKIDTSLLDRLGKKLDSSGEPPDDGDMLARIAKLESDLTAIKVDLAVIKANGASKSDIVEVRELVRSNVIEFKAEVDKASSKTGKDLADSQLKIIMWVVAAIFLAQLLPMVKGWLEPKPTAGSPVRSEATTAPAVVPDPAVPVK